MTMIKNIKFWIGENNDQYSRKVQEYLYSQGVKWNGLIWNGGVYEPVHFTNKASLFIDGDGDLFYVNYNKARFDCEDKFIEMKLIETVTYSLEEVNRKEKICIGEKSYYIDELTKALENIKHI